MSTFKPVTFYTRDGRTKHRAMPMRLVNRLINDKVQPVEVSGGMIHFEGGVFVARSEETANAIRSLPEFGDGSSNRHLILEKPAVAEAVERNAQAAPAKAPKAQKAPKKPKKPKDSTAPAKPQASDTPPADAPEDASEGGGSAEGGESPPMSVDEAALLLIREFGADADALKTGAGNFSKSKVEKLIAELELNLRVK